MCSFKAQRRRNRADPRMAGARELRGCTRHFDDGIDSQQRFAGGSGSARGDSVGALVAAGMVRAGAAAVEQLDETAGKPGATGGDRGAGGGDSRVAPAGLLQENDLHAGGGPRGYRGGSERLSESGDAADGAEFSVWGSGNQRAVPAVWNRSGDRGHRRGQRYGEPRRPGEEEGRTRDAEHGAWSGDECGGNVLRGAGWN